MAEVASLTRTYQALAEAGTTFRTSQARALGLNSRALARLVAAGQIERVARGVYAVAASAQDLQLAEIAMRAPMATICLTSALAHYELIDDIPAAHDLALPRGAYRPRLEVPHTWHAFDADTFDIDRDRMPITGTTLEVGIYSAARSIVDAFRMRRFEGYETGINALREWLSHRGNHPAQLLDIAARLPRATGPLRTALEHLS